MILSSSQHKALASADCDVAFDNLTRRLYATDASLYQIEPAAVAFPRNAQQASSIIKRAADANVPIIPRGAGTGLGGGALGEGVVVEFARYNREISHLNLDAKSVRVGAGVVLDQLNAFLKPRGYCFGPDVATSSRATIGGMIANNSSGSHVPVYGTTADHVLFLELAMTDGRIETAGRGHAGLGTEHERIGHLIGKSAAEIERRMPAGLMKRWPGYGVDRAVHSPGHLPDILAGSEGTLAAIASAELRIVPLPKGRGLALLFFDSVTEAMQATVDLLDLKPAAIEHLDHVLFDQTKGQLAFKAARDFLELDAKPCRSILVVEFFDNVAEKLSVLAERHIGLRRTLVTSPMEMALVWGLRKAGLSLLTSRKGAAKPVTGIEDTAVRPEQLPDYVASLQSILKPLAVETCFYGHAATGLLHVRPVLDLHEPDDLKKFRTIAEDVSALVKQFKGSLAAEHGVGIARTEFIRDHLGDEILELMRRIKGVFDPRDVMNPGKIFGNGFRIDAHLRPNLYNLPLRFKPVLGFVARDESFIGNLEQCNGCGGCRKEPPTMCPTFVATGDEVMSTRGRANLIRAALEARGVQEADPLVSGELEIALSNCLSCKACTTECPSNVNMALLKAELLNARHQKYGLTWRERLVSSAARLGRLGCMAPALANATLQSKWLRELLRRTCRITARRPLPAYARQRFDHWFKTCKQPQLCPRGRVVLWDDTFVRYNEPHIGKAAVAVLEAAGFHVNLVDGRRCCGRPAFSQGNLPAATRAGHHNLALLQERYAGLPIVFLEPSCYSMFAEDYRELGLKGAAEVASRSYLFEQFIEQLLGREPDAISFKPLEQKVAIHAHCHAKSLLNVGFMSKLGQRATTGTAAVLDTGCCGMAGAFGMLEEKYDLSVKVAEPLLRTIEQQPNGCIIVASGASCRHQIEHLSAARPRHMAEVLAEALAPSEHLNS
jgi:FAD/FMN-containing dehydrogenase/Fe-S oxidoreductase